MVQKKPAEIYNNKACDFVRGFTCCRSVHQIAGHVACTGVTSCIEFSVNIVLWCQRALRRQDVEMKLCAVCTLLKINPSNTNSNTSLSSSPRFSEGALLSRRFPGFASLYFWYMQPVDGNESGELVAWN